MKLAKYMLLIVLIQGSIAMAGNYQQADIYSDLRMQALNLTKEQLGRDVQVLAVLMETGYPEAVVTLVSVADGTSSLYFSTGGGIVGAGEYKQVADSSLALVAKANENINNLKLTKEYPLPKKGYTRVYVVTSSGVYTEEVLEDDLGNEKHKLSPVFFQAHELISYIRAAEEHRNAEQVQAEEHR